MVFKLGCHFSRIQCQLDGHCSKKKYAPAQSFVDKNAKPFYKTLAYNKARKKTKKQQWRLQINRYGDSYTKPKQQAFYHIREIVKSIFREVGNKYGESASPANEPGIISFAFVPPAVKDGGIFYCAQFFVCRTVNSKKKINFFAGSKFVKNHIEAGIANCASFNHNIERGRPFQGLNLVPD